MILAIFILFLLAEFLNACAAAFNAGMDKMETEIQYNNSVFPKYNDKEYWSKVESAKVNGFIKGTTRRRDGWHDFKSAMIVCDALCCVCIGIATGLLVWLIGANTWELWLIIPFLSIHFTVRIRVFNYYYNKVFKKK